MSNSIATEVAEDFKDALSDLTINDRAQINNLMIIAKENTEHAQAISRVLENHIRETRPEFKLPALYVLDAIVKFVGTPYNIYLGRNLYRTFMDAYSMMVGSTRKAMDNLLQTWKIPPPESLETRPVFPPETTKSIETALIRYRTVAIQNQQVDACVRGQHANFAARPGQVEPWRNTPTPPQHTGRFPSVAVQNQQLDPRRQAQAHMSAPVPSGPNEPWRNTPTPPQLPFNLPPATLQQHLFTTRPEHHVPHQIPNGLSAFNFSEPWRAPQTPPQNNPTQPSNPSISLAQLLQQFAPAPASTPAASTAALLQQQPAISLPFLHPSSTLATAPPALPFLQPASTPSNVPLPLPLPFLQPSGKPSNAPPNLPFIQPISTPVNASLPTNQPSLSHTNATGASIVNVELTTTSITKHSRPQLAALLYDTLPNQCSDCGRRFANTEEGKQMKAKHMDWHFKTKDPNLKNHLHRSLYLSEKEWIDYREQDEASLENKENSHITGSPSNKKDAKQRYLRVPSDIRLQNSPCPICQEKFEKHWLVEANDFVWIDAIKVGGKTYHASCFQEVNGTSRSILGKRTRTAG